jgi:hypothetical protein
MTEFNLYQITNHDTDHMTNPMKHTALFLGFIQGPIVQAWIQRQTQWMVDQLTTGLANMDEGYWTHISNEFQSTFQDTGTKEHGQDKLQNLPFIPGEVDTFIAQFETLAHEANFPSMPTTQSPCLHISKITGPFPSGFRPFLFSGPSQLFRYRFPEASRQLAEAFAPFAPFRASNLSLAKL